MIYKTNKLDKLQVFMIYQELGSGEMLRNKLRSWGLLAFDLAPPLLSHPPRCDIRGTRWENERME